MVHAAARGSAASERRLGVAPSHHVGAIQLRDESGLNLNMWRDGAFHAEQPRLNMDATQRRSRCARVSLLDINFNFKRS